jgi:hypothetical protein
MNSLPGPRRNYFAHLNPGLLSARPGNRPLMSALTDTEASAAADSLSSFGDSPMNNSDSALPLMATASDLREIVKFLRKKPEGVGIVEAMEVSKKQTLDPRKIAAYEYWGIVIREKDRLRLSDFGNLIAGQLQSDTRAFCYVLMQTELYRLTLNWIHTSNFDLVTHSDISEYWRQEFSENLRGKSEAILKGNVISFFHLCHAAELGTVTIGKRGQPARMKVDQEELVVFFFSENADNDSAHVTLPASFASLNSAPALNVLLIHRQNEHLAQQIAQTLIFSGVQSETIIRDEGALLPVSEAFSSALRRCHAGVVVLALDDYDKQGVLRQNVLSEINALCLLYSGRVIVLYEEGLQLPDGLAVQSCCTFRHEQLSWETGLHLMQTIQRMK